MLEHIYTQHWITLDKETREHLTKVFNIPTSGIAEIRDQTLISDGKTNTDLQAITSEAMEAYVGSKEPFARLWELTLMKSKYELHPPTIEIGVGEIIKKELSEDDYHVPNTKHVETKKKESK